MLTSQVEIILEIFQQLEYNIHWVEFKMHNGHSIECLLLVLHNDCYLSKKYSLHNTLVQGRSRHVELVKVLYDLEVDANKINLLKLFLRLTGLGNCTVHALGAFTKPCF